MSAVLKPSALRLEAMLASDLERVLAIENDIYEFPWTRGNFTDSMKAGYHCWVAQGARHHDAAPLSARWGRGAATPSITAYAVVMVGAGEAHLLNLSVARATQGQGIGGAMLGEVMAAAMVHGAQNMLLEVRPSNLAGRALYARAGFVQLGVRKAYYPAKDGREDALVLGRDLTVQQP